MTRALPRIRPGSEALHLDFVHKKVTHKLWPCSFDLGTNSCCADCLALQPGKQCHGYSSFVARGCDRICLPGWNVLPKTAGLWCALGASTYVAQVGAALIGPDCIEAATCPSMLHASTIQLHAAWTVEHPARKCLSVLCASSQSRCLSHCAGAQHPSCCGVCALW